jgi:hypothetical protein
MNTIFEAWRGRDPDDLAFALFIAIWAAGNRRLDPWPIGLNPQYFDGYQDKGPPRKTYSSIRHLQTLAYFPGYRLRCLARVLTVEAPDRRSPASKMPPFNTPLMPSICRRLFRLRQTSRQAHLLAQHNLARPPQTVQSAARL